MQSNIGDEDDDDRMEHFDRPWTSVFKILTMFVGELEFSDLPTEMQTVGDTGDISLLFFLAGANFW